MVRKERALYPLLASGLAWAERRKRRITFSSFFEIQVGLQDRLGCCVGSCFGFLVLIGLLAHFFMCSLQRFMFVSSIMTDVVAIGVVLVCMPCAWHDEKAGRAGCA